MVGEKWPDAFVLILPNLRLRFLASSSPIAPAAFSSAKGYP